MIDAENSDVFDVLAYIAFALAPITRSERAGSRTKQKFSRAMTTKLQAFLGFRLLAQSVRQGVEELDEEKLASLVQLKYHTIANAADELGGVPRHPRHLHRISAIFVRLTCRRFRSHS